MKKFVMLITKFLVIFILLEQESVKTIANIHNDNERQKKGSFGHVTKAIFHKDTEENSNKEEAKDNIGPVGLNMELHLAHAKLLAVSHSRSKKAP